jgi:predicted ArsR family transcriptional regulator
MSSTSESATANRRRRVMVALRESSTPLGVGELAEQLGIHPNTVRFHLDTLVRTGQVERVQGAPVGPGRPPLAFRISPGMDPMGPRNYQLLAGMLVDQLAAEPDAPGHALAAGRAWGRQLHTPASARRGRRRPDGVEQLVELLADLGFEPERRSSDHGSGQIALHNCPFLDLVESRTHVVCPIHLGLMQGAMAAAQSPVTVERLEPFVEPGLCLAHLGPAQDGS